MTHEENGYILSLTIESMKKGLETYINNPALIDLHGKISKANVQKRSASGTAELYHQLISEIYHN